MAKREDERDEARGVVVVRAGEILGGLLKIDRTHFCNKCEEVDKTAASYAAGLEAGIRRHVWTENGIEYVGSRPKTKAPLLLSAALVEAGLVPDIDKKEEDEITDTE